MNWKTLAVIGLVGSVVLGGEPRRRGGQTYVGPFVASNASMDDPGELALPAYTGNAPLTRARIHARWHLGYAFEVENLSAVDWWGQPFYPQLYTNAWVRKDGVQAMPALAPSVSVLMCNLDLAPYDGQLDYAGQSGTTQVVPWNICLQPDYWTVEVIDVQDPLWLQRFIDPSGWLDLVIAPQDGILAVPGIDIPEAGDLSAGYRVSDWSIIVDRIEYNPAP